MPRRDPIVKNTPDPEKLQHGGAPFLREIRRRRKGDEDQFPFSVPVVRALDTLSFDSAVTFFVGANGSGKSTLLEGIASAARLPAVGSADLGADATLGAQRALGDALRLVWSRRTTKGFFLRAEDFFGFAKRLSSLRGELLGRIDEIEVEYADRSEWAKGLAMGPAKSSLADMERRYGVDLDANSHGQSFLKLFQSRFVPGGLYLLDEPEAPLSPQSQLALMIMISEMVAQEAQFIVATHSPMLLAYPGAKIYSFDRAPAEEVPYGELDHVVLTRDFLNAPERYLRALEKQNSSGARGHDREE
jgi:predicted ATPase